MAAVVVRRNARSHQNLDALRTSLAQNIENESSRRVFLERTEALVRTEISRPQSQPLVPSRTEPSAPAGAPTQSPVAQFDAVFLTAVEAELAHHLGPLARVLVKNSALKARDRAELFLLLSDHIADETQRRAFIRKSVAAFRDQT
jgi:serine/threonine-protein kinase